MERPSTAVSMPLTNALGATGEALDRVGALPRRSRRNRPRWRLDLPYGGADRCGGRFVAEDGKDLMSPDGGVRDAAPCPTLLSRGPLQPSARSPEFICEVRPDRERAIVRVGGELDLCAAPHVAAAVDELLDVGFAHVVIDLRDLSFLDSAGVHTLVAAQCSAALRGSALSLVRGSGHVQCVLELTATGSLFAFDDGIDA